MMDISSWDKKELKILDDLRKRNETRTKDLENILRGCPDIPKWAYPKSAMKIVEEARKDSKNFQKPLGRGLQALLEWPEPENADPSFFLPGKGPNGMFDRTEQWFDKEGFYKYKTPYTFSDDWDKEPIYATFFVPKNLPKGCKAPVMWFFHGGGFCTGAGDAIPWYSQTAVRRAKQQNAIIIAPDYPLGPEGNYKDIVDSIKDFLRWYKEDGSFDPKYKSWTDFLINQEPKQNYQVDTSRIYVEGESAGGHAAVMAIWLNAAKNGSNIPINAALLRYPMLAHYEREWPNKDINGGKAKYMEQWFELDRVQEKAQAVKDLIQDLESLNLVPTCAARTPPKGMAFAFFLSVTKTWQSFFQRQHGENLGKEVRMNDPDFMDCIERAENCSNDVDHTFLPPMYIYHGNSDPNCPIQNTEKFVDVVRKGYSDRYGDEKMLHLERVTVLNWKKVWNEHTKEIGIGKVVNVGHAFDYDLDEAKEDFLKRAYDWVVGRW